MFELHIYMSSSNLILDIMTELGQGDSWMSHQRMNTTLVSVVSFMNNEWSVTELIQHDQLREVNTRLPRL